MLVRAILFGLILSAGVEAGQASDQPSVRVKKVAENFRFELCKKNSCEPLGREAGYTRAELESWKKFRENKAQDIAPLMFFAGAISVLVGGFVIFPVSAVVSLGALALGGFAYFFSQAPQVQARMPNDVYHEFQADPSLLPSFKSFLRELDEGMPVLDQQPRVLSGRASPKVDRPETPPIAPSAPRPVDQAR